MNSKTKGILYVITAAFGFSMMSVFVHLAGDMPTFQKAFFRNAAALVFVAIIMIKNKITPIPKRENLPALFGRAFFGTIGLVSNFYAIDRLVLADANMLNKLSPFFAIIFSIFLLKERPTFVQIFGVLAAFVGSLFIIKPSMGGYAVFPAAVGALGGMSAGLAYTFVRFLGRKGENSFRIIFFFSAFSCLVCIPFMVMNFEPFTFKSFIFLILSGVSASLGQFGITKAYLCAPAKEISVYDYTQVLFAAVFGFFLFNQVPDLLSILGYILICGAGIAMFFYNRNRD
ncbi:MAG: DMT family transporter [Clostridiales bacterium]|nr:DMT family transporter [Clostridiales bacterium]MBD9010442.1 DMT family transporter [Clostridiales bacterium]